jgi:hypothetical protein
LLSSFSAFPRGSKIKHRFNKSKDIDKPAW